MFGGPGGMRDLMGRERMQTRDVKGTLARFAHYFRPFWPLLIGVALLVVVSTWTQVTTPDLTGQTVDCYLTPAVSSTFGSIPGLPQQAAAAQTNCWLAKGFETNDLTHQFFRGIATATNMPVPSVDGANPLDDTGRLVGLGAPAIRRCRTRPGSAAPRRPGRSCGRKARRR